MPEVMENALKRILTACKWDATSARRASGAFESVDLLRPVRGTSCVQILNFTVREKRCLVLKVPWA